MQASPWLESYFALNNTTETIGDVSASTLILQGENDSQIPVQEARLLEQKLVEVNHLDHTLIMAHLLSVEELDSTPGADGRECAGGSASWLTSPERKARDIAY